MTLLIDEARIQAARREGYFYVWKLELPNGKIIDQFDNEGNPKRGALLDHIYRKPKVDPYSGTTVLTGIRRGVWAPTIEGLRLYAVDVEDLNAMGLVLYRKNYMGSSGFHYITYCIGARYEDPDISEKVIHICPPTKWQGKSNAPLRKFEGGATVSSDPLHKNAFDVFCAENDE